MRLLIFFYVFKIFNILINGINIALYDLQILIMRGCDYEIQEVCNINVSMDFFISL